MPEHLPGRAVMSNGFHEITDEGTSARIDHHPPGPIGFDSRGGGRARPSSASISEQVLAFARRHRSEQVGDGECFALADQALRTAGGKSAADYGDVSRDADYVWGAAVSLADAQPGDVIQFRDYRYDRRIDIEHSDGSSEWKEDEQKRDHHTAVVERVGANGELTVLEQNAEGRKYVVRTTLFFSNRHETHGGRTTTIRVSGTFRFYRGQPR
jgi:hypothetical protein